MHTSTVANRAGLGTLRKPCFRFTRLLGATRLRCKPESERSSVTEEPVATPNVSEVGDSPKKSASEAIANTGKDASKIAKNVATAFAPRPSGAVKNPAIKGSLLYKIFGWQAWGSAVVGGLLAYNILLPSDEPSIARLMGMWSVWMFTIPSLRARECTSKEKDALNILFLLVPLLNVTIPFISRSFAVVYTSDLVALAAIFYWKLGPPSDENAKEAT